MSSIKPLSALAEQEDISWKVRLCLMDTQRAELPGPPYPSAGESAGAGARNPARYRILLPHNDPCSRK